MVRIDIKQVPQDHHSNFNKSNQSKSKAGARLNNVLSDSEDLPIPSESSPRPAPSKRSVTHISTVTSSPLYREKKNFLSKNLFTQSSDSDSFRDSNESSSLAAPSVSVDTGFQTPVRSKSYAGDNGGKISNRDGEGHDDENDDAAVAAEAMRSHQLLQMERKQLEIERKQFEFEKKMFETEKNQFENEKKVFQKQKERMEQERMNQSEGTPAKDISNSSTSPTKIKNSSDESLAAVAAELTEVEEKYQKVVKDCEGLRRENIGLQLEIEKGKKTLDAEKNVRPTLIHH